MDDWYGVLQVAPGADPDVIVTAHRWLSERYDPARDPSEEAAEKLRQVNEAFAVLNDSDRRAAYDAARGLTPTVEPAEKPATAPVVVAPLQAETAAVSTSRVASVMLGVIVAVTFVVALSVAITAAVTGDEETSYNAERGDDDYDIEHMAFTERDMPEGLQFVGSGEFSAEEWATLFDVLDEDELAAKVAQLEAQGWLKNYVSEGGRPGFGRIIGVKSVSTLYTNEERAIESTDRFACGLPIELSEQLDEFRVPAIADQAVGFLHHRPIRDDSGQIIITFVDTTVCFRTGRIVHAVQQTALEGVHDIGASVRAAYILLDHVNDAYNGTVPEEDKEEDEDG